MILKVQENIFVVANENVHDMRVTFDKVKDAISCAQEKHKKIVAKYHEPLSLKEDEWVLLQLTKARLSHMTGKKYCI